MFFEFLIQLRISVQSAPHLIIVLIFYSRGRSFATLWHLVNLQNNDSKILQLLFRKFAEHFLLDSSYQVFRVDWLLNQYFNYKNLHQCVHLWLTTQLKFMHTGYFNLTNFHHNLHMRWLKTVLTICLTV